MLVLMAANEMPPTRGRGEGSLRGHRGLPVVVKGGQSGLGDLGRFHPNVSVDKIVSGIQVEVFVGDISSAGNDFFAVDRQQLAVIAFAIAEDGQGNKAIVEADLKSLLDEKMGKNRREGRGLTVLIAPVECFDIRVKSVDEDAHFDSGPGLLDEGLGDGLGRKVRGVDIGF